MNTSRHQGVGPNLPFLRTRPPTQQHNTPLSTFSFESQQSTQPSQHILRNSQSKPKAYSLSTHYSPYNLSIPVPTQQSSFPTLNHHEDGPINHAHEELIERSFSNNRFLSVNTTRLQDFHKASLKSEFSLYNEDFPALPGTSTANSIHFSMNSPSLQTQTRAHQDPSAPSDSIESLESKTSETERSTLSMHPPTPPSTQKKKSSDLKNQCFSSAITLKKYSAPHKHPPSLLKSSRAGQPSYKAQQQSQSVASVASQIQPPPYYRPAPFQQGLTTCTSHSQPSRSFVEPNNFSGQQDPYGMHGLLRALQVADTDWNLLALGLDLSTLGLNFNSTDSLISSGTSASPSNPEDEYRAPSCYMSVPPALPLATSKIKHLPEECLFYIFYAMPRDVLQQAAAAELYNRDWRFHRTLKLWFTRMMDSGQTGEPPEKSSFVYFDVVTWQKQIKKDFLLSYDLIDDVKLALPS